MRFDSDPKEKERGLAMMILGAISEYCTYQTLDSH